MEKTCINQHRKALGTAQDSSQGPSCHEATVLFTYAPYWNVLFNNKTAWLLGVPHLYFHVIYNKHNSVSHLWWHFFSGFPLGASSYSPKTCMLGSTGDSELLLGVWVNGVCEHLFWWTSHQSSVYSLPGTDTSRPLRHLHGPKQVR